MLDTKKISKLAIIAGKGELPTLIINKCIQQNINFVVGGIIGQTPKKSINAYKHFWFSIGGVSKFITELQQHNVTHICFIGTVKRPSVINLLTSLDKLGKQLLGVYLKNLLTATGDNNLLSLLISILEQQYNFKVISSQSIEPNILAQAKDYDNVIIPSEYWQDIAVGFNIAKSVGELDIGQSIIVQQKVIIAVEGVEGTDNLIKRSKKLLYKQGRKGLLIKVKKPNQEERVDLPTIGLKTLKQVKKTGLLGVIIEANSTIVINPQQVKVFAKQHGLLVKAISHESLNNKLPLSANNNLTNES